MENIANILPSEFDLLCIDIDGNDYWIWKAIQHKPAFVIIEYNIYKQRKWILPYDPNLVESSGYLKLYGASEESLVELAEEKGYEYVFNDPFEPNFILLTK